MDAESISASRKSTRTRGASVNYKEVDSDSDDELFPFLVSDDDGSASSSDSSSDSESEDDEYYDASATKKIRYDKLRGQDSWIGRRICKVFENHGEFDGIIYAVDDDHNNPGYRLFMVHYFEDPDDAESMWPQEVATYVPFIIIFLTWLSIYYFGHYFNIFFCMCTDGFCRQTRL